MSLPHDEDDTSPGRITQGGHGPRNGHAVWIALAGAFIAIAVALSLTLGRHEKRAPAEEGTTPIAAPQAAGGAPRPAGATGAPP